MRRLMGLTAAVIAVMMLVLLPGCSDDDANGVTPPTDTEFELLTSYMAANNLDLPDLLSNWIIAAQPLFDGLGDYFIMDIRQSDKYGPGTSEPNGVPDFEDGHILGAHSVTLTNVVTYEAEHNTADLPVVVACYTGHDAGHAVMALRLSGVADAKSLKWGMSGWDIDFDFWTRFTGDAWLDYDGCWVDGDPETAPPELPNNTDRPELDTSLGSGSVILEYQIDHAVLDGLNGITNAEVLDAYDDYHIICYWGLSDWDVYGNITTAYQVTGGELGLETLGVLDPDGINVIYCWSGQTASMIAAWLNVLGYDGRTLKFSANGMIHDALDPADTRGIKWTENTSADLEYETGTGN